ncbi:MAG: hypothetical protein Q4G18_04590 [Myroides sp.]|nr:hypothetical protein [Myroides sp.]
MKKVFLSLATIAFVAAGSLTVTSCGSDDSAPNPEPGPGPGGDDNPPVENAAGKLTYDGEDFDLDSMRFLLHGTDTGWTVINEGTEEEPDYRSLWVGMVYSGDDAATASEYYQMEFTLPVEETQEGFLLILPNEVEPADFGLSIPYVEIGGTRVTLTGVNAGGINFNTFVYVENQPMTTDNESQFGIGQDVVISHEYSGEFGGIATTNLLEQSKGTNATYKNVVSSKTFSLKDLKNVKGTLAK